jgi:hypothetical protein
MEKLASDTRPVLDLLSMSKVLQELAVVAAYLNPQ